MEQYFASLSKRQTMLLLTAVTFGGANCIEALDHLPDEEAELLKHRAQALLQIPRDKRIPFLVQEIKRLVTARRRQLASADPARLAKVLFGERHALVEVVLRALPSQIADPVRKEVKSEPVKLQREVRPDILSIIRWKLEDAIRQSAPKGAGLFKFSDLLTLQSRELLTIADRMGARALATAIAGLPDADRDTFLAALPPDQKSLAQRASDAGKSRKLTEEDSRTVLEMHNAIKEPSAGMRSAGAQRLARAALAQSPEFAARLLERNAGEFGKLLIRWMREERNKPVRGDGGRMDIVEQMERLAQRGVIDRPMRLPPPAPKPPHPSGQMPGGQLVAPRPQDKRLPAPPEKRLSQQIERARSSSALPSLGKSSQALPMVERSRSASAIAIPERGRSSAAMPSVPSPTKENRRDFMAERVARKAGAASASHPVPRRPPDDTLPPPARPNPRPAGQRPRPAPGRPVTDPSMKAVKIMRDGKELKREDSGQRKGTRAPTSPALQEIPKRRNPPPGAPRSPILRDAGTASGRGPGRGSR